MSSFLNRFLYPASLGLVVSFALGQTPNFHFTSSLSIDPNQEHSDLADDLNHDGVIDGADLGLSLLHAGCETRNESILELDDIHSLLVGTGAQGLFAKNYIVDDAGTKYSVIDVYLKWGSAVGVGSNGERLVSFFGQSIRDNSTYQVDKTSQFKNSLGLEFQHANSSWLPNFISGNNAWDSFITIGARTQASGATVSIASDPGFLNPNSNAGSIAGLIGTGAGWYQSSPLDPGWETNVSTFQDHMIMLGRFTLKVSDILAQPSKAKLTVWCNFTAKSTAQTGGSTLYTLASANVKSDAQTKYTINNKIWTFDPTFEGATPGQEAWTFSTLSVNVPADYSTIQSAIDAVPTVGNWTITVAPGTYNEAIDFKGKAITVKATGARANTIIDGTGLTTSVVRAVTGETSATVLQGFTIRNGPMGSASGTYRLGGGIFISSASPTIRDCAFTANQSAYGGGMYALYSNSLVENCTFSQNSGSADGGGIQLFGGSPIVRNCVVSDNNAGNRGGGFHVVQHNTGAATLDGCTISGNRSNVSDGGGVSMAPLTGAAQKFLVSNCTITNNSAQTRGGGLWALVNPSNPQQNVTLTDNTICNNTSAISKRENVWALFEDGGNTICDCISDISGDGDVDTGDLSYVLLFVGETTDADFIQPDQDMNGFIDTADVSLVLLNMGACP